MEPPPGALRIRRDKNPYSAAETVASTIMAATKDLGAGLPGLDHSSALCLSAVNRWVVEWKDLISC